LLGYMSSGELLHVAAEYIQQIKLKCPHVKYSTYKFTICSSIDEFLIYSL